MIVAKDGTKLKYCIIFKGTSSNGIREYCRRSVAYELFDVIKNYVKTFISRDNNDNSKYRYNFVDFYIISNSITLKAHLLYLFLVKIIKEFNRNLYNTCILNAPVNPATSYPLFPNR